MSTPTDPGLPEPARIDPGSVRPAAAPAWPDTFEATIGGHKVAVFRWGTRTLAVGRYCPHKGADLARRGLPDPTRDVLICLAHAHIFRMADGGCISDERCSPLPVFSVELDDADPARDNPAAAGAHHSDSLRETTS